MVNDYVNLQDIFGQLLREIQRITSEGDFEAGKKLVENYGIKVDQDIHQEVYNDQLNLIALLMEVFLIQNIHY